MTSNGNAKIVVINLERSLERRQRMEAAFAEHELEAEFFPAIDARRGEHLLYPQYDQKASVRLFGEVMTPGEFACFASHFFVWRKCAAQDLPFLVCEDDILLEDRFSQAVDVVSPLVEELGLVRMFGTNWRRPFRVVRRLAHGFELVRFLRGPSGLQCYALSPSGAETLLANCTAWLEPVDRFVDRFWLHRLGHFAIRPFPVAITADAVSDIGERKRRKTVYTVPRKMLRVTDHLARTAFNLRHR